MRSRRYVCASEGQIATAEESGRRRYGYAIDIRLFTILAVLCYRGGVSCIFIFHDFHFVFIVVIH